MTVRTVEPGLLLLMVELALHGSQSLPRMQGTHRVVHSSHLLTQPMRLLVVALGQRYLAPGHLPQHLIGQRGRYCGGLAEHELCRVDLSQPRQRHCRVAIGGFGGGMAHSDAHLRHLQRQTIVSGSILSASQRLQTFALPHGVALR